MLNTFGFMSDNMDLEICVFDRIVKKLDLFFVTLFSIFVSLYFFV